MEEFHAVILPFPTHGHIHPMLNFARRLADSGVKITFVTDAVTHDRLRPKCAARMPGVEFAALPTRLSSIELVGTFKSPPLLIDAQAADLLQEDFEKLLPKLMHQSPPVSCIISDVLLSTWPQISAQTFQLSFIAFLTTNATMACINGKVPELIEQGLVPIGCKEGSKEEIISGIPGVPPLKFTEFPFWFHKESVIHLPKQLANISVQCQASTLLVNSIEQLEPAAFEAMRQHINKNSFAIGPLLEFNTELSDSAEEQICLQWLESQQTGSVLYIALGTLIVLNGDQYEELAKGLEASKQPFLWALRTGSVANMPEEFHKGFLERTKHQGLVVSWAPQLEILSHACVGGFLSHCGWGSVLDSIYCGKPLLCWPNMAEQNLNCKLVVDEWKMGFKFVNSRPGRENGSDGGWIRQEDVEDLIRRFMHGEEGKEVRVRAMEMRDLAVAAVAEGRTFVGILFPRGLSP